jgi:hypothetical protein
MSKDSEPQDRKTLMALADVGLRAVIDEATGYQDVRAPDDLRKYAATLGIEEITPEEPVQ